MGDFYHAWQDFWEGREKPKSKSEYVKGEKRYNSLIQKGRNMSGFPGPGPHTSKDICAALQNYAYPTPEIGDPSPKAPEPAKPAPEPKPEPKQALVSAPFTPPSSVSSGNDLEAAFDRVWRAWPMNTMVENEGPARAEFDNAVDAYGLQFVTTKCMAAAAEMENWERRIGIRNYLTNSLPTDVKRTLLKALKSTILRDGDGNISKSQLTPEEFMRAHPEDFGDI